MCAAGVPELMCVSFLWLEARHAAAKSRHTATRSATGGFGKGGVIRTFAFVINLEAWQPQGVTFKTLPRTLVNSGVWLLGSHRPVGPILCARFILAIPLVIHLHHARQTSTMGRRSSRRRSRRAAHKKRTDIGFAKRAVRIGETMLRNTQTKFPQMQ